MSSGADGGTTLPGHTRSTGWPSPAREACQPSRRSRHTDTSLTTRLLLLPVVTLPPGHKKAGLNSMTPAMLSLDVTVRLARSRISLRTSWARTRWRYSVRTASFSAGSSARTVQASSTTMEAIDSSAAIVATVSAQPWAAVVSVEGTWCPTPSSTRPMNSREPTLNKVRSIACVRRRNCRYVSIPRLPAGRSPKTNTTSVTTSPTLTA